jgi:hypothetical protein
MAIVKRRDLRHALVVGEDNGNLGQEQDLRIYKASYHGELAMKL